MHTYHDHLKIAPASIYLKRSFLQNEYQVKVHSKWTVPLKLSTPIQRANSSELKITNDINIQALFFSLSTVHYDTWLVTYTLRVFQHLFLSGWHHTLIIIHKSDKILQLAGSDNP